MPAGQLSLWDNESLERAHGLMIELHLEEALVCFHAANNILQVETNITQAAIDACNYWKTRITIEDEKKKLITRDLLTDFRQYPFTGLMKGFKRSLLNFIVDRFNPVSDWEEFEIAFDLLLEVKSYQKAEDFISLILIRNQEKSFLLYYLAQAQWLNGNKAKANEHYIIACIYWPDPLLKNRIENEKIVQIIETYGMVMAPLYACLLKVVPFIPDVNPLQHYNKEHTKALATLDLLRQLIKAFEDNNSKLLIGYRKQLKTENPSLYEVYFRQL